MSVQELINAGNSYLVDEEFESAARSYTQALEKDPKSYDALQRRSEANMRMKKYPAAIADADEAIKLNPDRAIGYLRKGCACFESQDYKTALRTFKDGLEHNPTDGEKSRMELFVRKCRAEISEQEEQEEERKRQEEKKKKEEEEKKKKEEEEQKKKQQEEEKKVEEKKEAPAEPPKKRENSPMVRHDWMQSTDAVTVSVYAKKVDPKDVSIDFEEQELSLSIKLGDGREFQQEWTLAHTIIPSKCSYKVMSMKIEIRLVKAESGLQWASLDIDAEDVIPHSTVPPSVAPTSSKNGPKDWDALAKEVEAAEEKPTGNDALDALMKQIYANGSDETRRAMIKSFQESGGTVLSTNWEEVSKKKVEGAAPKGQVMHKWNE